MSLVSRLTALSNRVAAEFIRSRTSVGINRRLMPFHMALAGQRDSRCNVVWFGDSVSEGAITWDDMPFRRGINVFEKVLREVPGGPGAFPSWIVSPFVKNPATYSVGASSDVTTDSAQPVSKYESVNLPSLGWKQVRIRKGGWVEWTFYGDAFRVWWVDHNWFALNAKVLVDGAQVGLISSGAASSETIKTWDSPRLARGQHTVRIQEDSGYLDGSFIFDLVEFFDGDRDNGVHLFDGAHSGAASANYADPSSRWPEYLSIFQPALVVMMFGFNDTSSRTPSQFQSDLQAMVDRIPMALGTYTLAIIQPWAPNPQPSAGWDAYMNASKAVADAHPYGVTVDLRDLWTKMTASGPNQGMYNDTVHPDTPGQRLMGEYVARTLGLPGKSLVKTPGEVVTFIAGSPAGGGTVTGSWEIPPLCTTIEIDVCGPGSGGGSGRRGATNTVRCGGGGGASGARSQYIIPVSSLPVGTTTLYYSIPAAGMGGAPVTVNDTNGNAGGSPRAMTWVSLQNTPTPYSNLLASTWYPTSSGGGGGTATTGTGGSGVLGASLGASGGAAATNGGVGGSGASSSLSSGAGGAGGGITSSNTVSAGGGGGHSYQTYPATSGGGAGTTGGGVGTSGNSVTSATPSVNGGGGGGGASATTAGGRGGDGGTYGGGGGGGGASLNGYASGGGGNGAPGYIRFVARF